MSAVLGQRRFPDLPSCAHCGAPIQTTNYSLGPKVEHYDPDASFRDSIWWHCRLTVATPRWTGAQPGPLAASDSHASVSPEQTPTPAADSAHRGDQCTVPGATP